MLIRDVMHAFGDLELRGDRARLDDLLAALRQAVDAGDPALLQGAHRALLLHLQPAADN